MNTNNPCSVPDWLRPIVGWETPEQQAACQRHDNAYTHGGTRTQRLRADLRLALDWLDADMDPDNVELRFYYVRQYGHTHWGSPDTAGVNPSAIHPPESEAQAP